MRLWIGLVIAVSLCLMGGSTAWAQHHSGFGGTMGMLMIKEVKKELRLDDSQLDQLRQANAELKGKSDERFRAIQNVPPEEREKRFEEFRQQVDHRIGEILDPRQKIRLRQLQVQAGGYRSLARKDVQDELKLDADQRSRVRSILDGEHVTMRQVFSQLRPTAATMTNEERQMAFAKAREVRTATDDQLSHVLRESQRRQFQAMKGAPFTFPTRHFPGQ